MAINVNTVYTTVLSILNKEQRGYLTPYEFNQAATQVQLDIFEKYFKDLDKQLRIPQNDFDYSNPIINMDDVMSTFKCFGSCVYQSNNKFNLPITDTITNQTIVYNDQPSSTQFAFYRLGTVTYEPSGTKSIQIERLQRDPFYNIDRSDLTAPSTNFPVYLFENLMLDVKPNTITSDVKTTFIRKPRDVVWAYSVNATLGNYVYAPTGGGGIIPITGSQDFEISSNQQTEVILEILKYAGVVIRDPQIVQAAAQELAGK
tara:strand:- start:5213 stop:5989 length:777 start_codon:yes stop_codon:yes gene_type:complete